MSSIRFSQHAIEQSIERGTNENEMRLAIQNGLPEIVKYGRIMFRYNFQYNDMWQGKFYAIKQVSPVVAIDKSEMIVVTVYTFYF